MTAALGHLGVQFAAKLGFNTVAIVRGADKEPLAGSLGSSLYRQCGGRSGPSPVQAGRAKVILATVTSADAMNRVPEGLATNSTLMVLGVTGPIEVSPVLSIRGRRSVKGWYSATSIASQDTLAFAAAKRRGADERRLSDRTNCEGISAQGGWPGAVSCGPDDRELAAPRAAPLGMGALASVNVNFPPTRLPLLRNRTTICGNRSA